MPRTTRDSQGRSSLAASAALGRLALAAAFAVLLAAAGAGSAAALAPQDKTPNAAQSSESRSTGSLAGDRHALMELYRATGGADWTNNAN